VNTEEMRAKALECDEKVRATRDPGLARMYSELGRQWRELADEMTTRSWADVTGPQPQSRAEPQS
jgi:hypothetical protein